MGLVAAIGLLAAATTASAAQVFVYNGSSVIPPGGPGASLCGVALCSAGAISDDFRLTLTIADAVTSISHNTAPGAGFKPADFISIVLETDFSQDDGMGGREPAGLTIFQTVSEDGGATNNVLPLFEEFELLIVGGIVTEMRFGFTDTFGPNPRGGMRPDDAFSFGVSFTGTSLGCDPFAGPAPGNGCALSNDPWIRFESGDFDAVPVPIPAAAWLFGSALGMLGWIRRRQVKLNKS